MSLKAFHIVFVIVSLLFLGGFGFWALQDFLATGDGLMLTLALASIIGFGVLVWYGIWFLRKLRGWSYL